MSMNISDEAKVNARKKDLEKQRKHELEDLRKVIQSPEGRRVMARIIAHCRVFSSVWHPSALIHKNAGEQELGQWIMGEIVYADPKAGAQMLVDGFVTELESKGEKVDD